MQLPHLIISRLDREETYHHLNDRHVHSMVRPARQRSRSLVSSGTESTRAHDRWDSTAVTELLCSLLASSARQVVPWRSPFTVLRQCCIQAIRMRARCKRRPPPGCFTMLPRRPDDRVPTSFCSTFRPLFVRKNGQIVRQNTAGARDNVLQSCSGVDMSVRVCAYTGMSVHSHVVLCFLLDVWNQRTTRMITNKCTNV
jgi:hypothetical protein